MKIENQNKNLDEKIREINAGLDFWIVTFENLTLSDSQKEFHLNSVESLRQRVTQLLALPMTTDQKIGILTAELSINRIEELLS